MQYTDLVTAAAAFAAACPPSPIPQGVQDVNTLAGLMSFAITVGVWWQVRIVRLSFRTRARLPQLVDDLRQQRQMLEDLLKTSTPSPVNAQRALATTVALLGNALSVVPKRSKRCLKDARRAVMVAARELGMDGAARRKELAAAFAALCVVEVDLNQVSLDLQWE